MGLHKLGRDACLTTGHPAQPLGGWLHSIAYCWTSAQGRPCPPASMGPPFWVLLLLQDCHRRAPGQVLSTAPADAALQPSSSTGMP